MKEQQAVSALQDAFKKNGIEARKLPRAAALRVSFMGSFHRVTYAGEGRGWLVNGYNEAGDPVKISELQALCEELAKLEPAQGEASDNDEAAPNPGPAQGEDLRQLQSAITSIEGTTYCNKAPRQNALLFDFQGEQYRVDAEENGWVVELVFGSGQHLERLQKLIPNLVASGAIATPEPDTITGKAITLQQPWAWAICRLGKNIENRSWPTIHRGELYIHAGRGWDATGAAWIAQNFNVEVPPQNKMASGELVAKCQVTECKHWSDTKEENLPWSEKFGFQWFLEDVEVLKNPIPLQGKLGIFPFSVVDPAAMDPCDVDSNAWCVANSPIADDEIDELGVPGTQVGSFTMLPTREDEAAVRRRHLIKRIYALASRTGVRIDGDSGLTLRDPEECPMADLEKICNQLLTLPPISDGIEWWRSRQDDDHGEPINYRPTAEVTR
ncbi:ASCH domain-containing protein [Laspinema olomoucense]|uniref:ASCH domain-containing protein n=1 Tax=Laspinema olomoucense TaxID=3231600 RepID=UPI0021BABA59|nr:ASCH domain-containing protein [Laspinema sp. D3d]MCT7971102.1 ASCH domain-containing protein [Laspinema sp. D3d]